MTQKIYRSEAFIQANCISWFRNEFERFGKGVIIPVPNELARKRRDVIIKKGCSDLIVVLSSKVIFIELKTAYNDQFDEQRIFESEVTALNHPYHVVKSLEEFKNIIEDEYNNYKRG